MSAPAGAARAAGARPRSTLVVLLLGRKRQLLAAAAALFCLDPDRLARVSVGRCAGSSPGVAPHTDV